MKQFIEYLIPIPDIGFSDDLYHTQVLDGIMRSCTAEAFQVVPNISPVLKPTSFKRDYTDITGIILSNPLQDHSMVDKLQQSGIPFVVIGTPGKEKIFSVDIDVVGAAFQLAHFLMQKGHSNIFYINSPGTYIYSSQNKAGFKLAHEENNIPWKEEACAEKPISSEAGYKSAEAILNNQPGCTAIVTTNEIVATGVLDKLFENGKGKSKKIDVVSMGGTPIGHLYKPGITTIDFHPKNLGAVAANLLIEVIRKKRIRPSHLLLPTKLIERDTA